ncbi:MAG: hypothetical protein GY768_24260 [Planctomycetaceae bacterium]|nr:hypothetical protein [Planctomycetaceae bacterium]
MCRFRLLQTWDTVRHNSAVIGLMLTISIWLPSNSPALANEGTFPTAPENWINSAPISLQGLEKKGAFLWFFEET